MEQIIEYGKRHDILLPAGDQAFRLNCRGEHIKTVIKSFEEKFINNWTLSKAKKEAQKKAEEEIQKKSIKNTFDLLTLFLRIFPLPLNPLQQHPRRLILPPFHPRQFRFGRHQFPPERLREYDLGQPICSLFPGCHPLLDAVGEGEEGFDPADDLMLFGERRN